MRVQKFTVFDIITSKEAAFPLYFLDDVTTSLTGFILNYSSNGSLECLLQDLHAKPFAFLAHEFRQPPFEYLRGLIECNAAPRENTVLHGALGGV